MLKYIIAVSGWVFLGLYLFYEHQEYGSRFLGHLFSRPDYASQLLFHTLIFLTPALSTYAGYLLHQREALLKELLKKERLESLSTLSGSLAHDFNSLISIISRNISLAGELADTPGEARKKLEEAGAASAWAKELAQELLAFSKSIKPAKRTASVEEIIRKSGEVSLNGSKVTCKYEIPEDLWPVEIDEELMGKAIDGLIGNAAHSMPGGGTIFVRCENASVRTNRALPLKKGDYVKITIKDRGGGIPEDQLQRLFDPYASCMRQKTGLGLACAFSIIQQHEGYVTAKSDMGIGTTYSIHVPAAGKDAPQAGG